MSPPWDSALRSESRIGKAACLFVSNPPQVLTERKPVNTWPRQGAQSSPGRNRFWKAEVLGSKLGRGSPAKSETADVFNATSSLMCHCPLHFSLFMKTFTFVGLYLSNFIVLCLILSSNRLSVLYSFCFSFKIYLIFLKGSYKRNGKT